MMKKIFTVFLLFFLIAASFGYAEPYKWETTGAFSYYLCISSSTNNKYSGHNFEMDIDVTTEATGDPAVPTDCLTELYACYDKGECGPGALTQDVEMKTISVGNLDLKFYDSVTVEGTAKNHNSNPVSSLTMTITVGKDMEMTPLGSCTKQISNIPSSGEGTASCVFGPGQEVDIIFSEVGTYYAIATISNVTPTELNENLTNDTKKVFFTVIESGDDVSIPDINLALIAIISVVVLMFARRKE